MPTFDTLAQEFLAHHFAESPASATFHGVDGYDALSPELSAESWERRDADDGAWAERFGALDDGELSADERIERDLVLSHLRGRALRSPWLEWRRQPDTYLNPGLMGVFSLFARRLHPEPELVAAAVARLDATPDLLAAGRANLDPGLAHPRLVERGLGQCRAAVTYARHLVPAEVDDPDLRARLAEAGESAAQAYEGFAGFLTDLAARAHGEWAIGEALYTALLRDKEMLAFDAGELRRRGQAAYDELDTELAGLAGDGQGDGWRAELERLTQDRPATPEDMLAGYQRWTEEARRFLVERELVTLPDGEHCEVAPSPTFQRPVLAVASYFQPPAFRPSLHGRFNVPYPPDGTTEHEVALRLADNRFASMPTTSVHEAYPGHHWHYTMVQTAGRPLRMILTTPYCVEGWALYSEKMMREQGFFTDLASEMCHLDARLFRAARIVVDTSLHCGGMTFDDAVAFMRDRAGLTEPVARAEVTRYCAWPTQAAAYLTGSLEIERLRERWFTEERGDLRGFHDTVASSGGLPLALAERAVLG